MLAAAASLLLSLLIPVLHQFPQPQFHDEFSYLLSGETFASGRLTNPPSPFAEHFETYQVLQKPTYMSKYPPGQGLALAAGIVLTGLPSFGVWLSSALAVAAVVWAMQAMLPRRWALLGGLIAATHPLMQQWNNSYRGGSVALLGGALLVGAAARMTRAATSHARCATSHARCATSHAREQVEKQSSELPDRSVTVAARQTACPARPATPAARPAIVAAIGVSILANSRPYEGLLLTILVGATVLLSLWRRSDATQAPGSKLPGGTRLLAWACRKGATAQLVAPCGRGARYGPLVAVLLVVALNFAWMAIYNHAVTGDPLRLPYVEYESQYALTPAIVLLPPPRQDKTYTHASMETYYRAWELPQYLKQDTLKELPGAIWEKLRIAQRALFRAGNEADQLPAAVTALRWLIVLPWLALPLALIRCRKLRAVAVLLALFLLGSFLALWFFPHYAAPAGVLLVTLHVGLLRYTMIALPRRAGLAVLWLALIGHGVDGGSYLFRLGRGDFIPWTQERIELLDDLQRDPNRWLVLVSDLPDVVAHIEWVFNGPDQHDGKVVFARSIDAPRDAAIIGDFASRGYRVGRLHIDRTTLRWQEMSLKR
jgi:hypothetical protein